MSEVEELVKQLEDLRDKLVAQETHLESAIGVFENMSGTLFNLSNRLRIIEEVLFVPSDGRINCPKCGRLIQTASKRCGFCG